MCILLKVLVLEKTKHFLGLLLLTEMCQVGKVRKKTPCLLWTLPTRKTSIDSQ